MHTFWEELKFTEGGASPDVSLAATGCVLWYGRSQQLQRLQ